jgi:hypothetical protein
MILKNPDKLLRQWIAAETGDIWFVDDVTVTMNEQGTAYIFRCITELPVKSSPNQQYYHQSRRVHTEVTLILNDNNTYSLLTDGMIKRWDGFCWDIDTMDKFISVVAEVLPHTDNL